MRKDFIISIKYTNRSSGGVEAPKKLHSPVKHCGLSSRRSRVQIPAGAHLSYSTIEKITPKNKCSLVIKQPFLAKIDE